MISSFLRTPSLLKKFLLTYITVFLLPTAIAFLVTYNASVRSLSQEIRSLHLYKTQQIAADLDLQLLSMKNTAYEISGMEELRLSKTNMNVIEETRVLKELDKRLQNNTLADNIFFMFRNDENLYTTDGKYNIDIYTRNVLNVVNPSVFSEPFGKIDVPFFVKEPANNHEMTQDTRRASLFVCPISTTGSFDKNAIVSFIISKESLKARVRTVVGNLQGGLYIFTEKGEIISSLPTSEIAIEKGLFAASQGIRGDFGEFKFQQRKYILFKAIAPKSDLSCVIVMPFTEYLEQVFKFQSIIFVVISLTFICGMLLAIFFSYNTYRPIQKAVGLFKDQLPQLFDEKLNEMDNLSSILTTTLGNNENYKQLLEENTRTIRHQSIVSILKGSPYKFSSESSPEMLLIDHYTHHVVLVLRNIKPHIVKSHTFIDLILDLIEKNYASNGKVYGADLNLEDTVVLLCSLNNTNEEITNNMANEIMRKCHTINIYVKIGIGGLFEKLEKAGQSYLEALSAAEHPSKDILEGSIVPFSEVNKSYSDFSWYPSEQLSRYLQSLKHGDRSASEEYLKELFDEIAKNAPSLIIQKFICFNLVNTVINTAREIMPGMNPSVINSLIHQEGITLLKSEMLTLTNQVCSFIHDNNAQKNNKLMNDICAYINKHYLEYDIDLSKLANEFDLSIYYLSRSIKDFTGMPFRNHIIYLRMEYSKKLLSESNISIKSIAETIGYTNVSHYIKTFKTMVGITPAQYRKQKIEKEPEGSES